MKWVPTVLGLIHLIGLALAVGAASVKVALLLRCRSDRSFIEVYLKVVRPITRQLVVGMILLTLTGVGWLVYGFPLTRTLIVKLVLVGMLWILGPVIDNVAEPRFRRFATGSAGSPSVEFLRAEKVYLALEMTATAILYVVVGIWVLR